MENKFDFEKFKNYVNTYPTDPIDILSNKDIILDMLYGLGISLEPQEYRWRTGFSLFLNYLLSDVINISEHDLDTND